MAKEFCISELRQLRPCYNETSFEKVIVILVAVDMPIYSHGDISITYATVQMPGLSTIHHLMDPYILLIDPSNFGWSTTGTSNVTILLQESANLSRCSAV
jgi:hypothetical protein